MESDDNDSEIESPVKVTKKRSGAQIVEYSSSDEETETDKSVVQQEDSDQIQNSHGEEHENEPGEIIKGEFLKILRAL